MGAMWSAPLITTTPAGAIKEDDFATAQTAFNQKLNDAANPPTQATQVAAVAPQTPMPVPTHATQPATQPPITSALDADATVPTPAVAARKETKETKCWPSPCGGESKGTRKDGNGLCNIM